MRCCVICRGNVTDCLIISHNYEGKMLEFHLTWQYQMCWARSLMLSLSETLNQTRIWWFHYDIRYSPCLLHLQHFTSPNFSLTHSVFESLCARHFQFVWQFLQLIGHLTCEVSQKKESVILMMTVWPTVEKLFSVTCLSLLLGRYFKRLTDYQNSCRLKTE